MSRLHVNYKTLRRRVLEAINARLQITISLQRIIPAKPRVGIALLVQDRPEYLEHSLRSLLETNTRGLHVTLLLHDDGSIDQKTKRLIQEAKSEQINIIKYRRDKPGGTWGGAFNSAMDVLLKSGEYDVVGSADSDAYFHPDWLTATLDVARYAKKHYRKQLLGPFSSFNSSDQEFHKVLDQATTPYGSFWVKERMGALNYLYCYEDFVKLGKFEENRDDETLMTERFKRLHVRNFCTEVSYVEHIGQDSILNKSRPVPVAQAVHALNLKQGGWIIHPSELKIKMPRV